MNRTAGKQKPMRKHRNSDATRPRALNRAPASSVRGGVSASVPTPANDTDLATATDLDLDGALPEILGAEAALSALGPEGLDVGVAGGGDGDVAHADAEESDAAIEESEPEDEDEAEDEAPVVSATRRKRGDDEPASFLGMYFRDMAELDVLRPEQEFETARQIEEMETDIWKTILGFAPGASWIADTIDRAVGQPQPDLKSFQLVAERSRRKSSIQARVRFEKEIARLATKLRVMDIDRIFLEAAVTEIHRVGRAIVGLPFEGQVPFSTGTKAFRDYVRVVGQKAVRLKAAKNEFVKANLRLVVSIARRFNHGPLAAGRPHPGGQHRPHEGGRALRLSSRLPLLDLRELVDPSRHQPRAGRQGPRGAPAGAHDRRVPPASRSRSASCSRSWSARRRPQELAAATGIEAEKLEKMKTFLAETPVSLDRPISDEDGRQLIDVLVDPNEGPAVPEQMVSTETQSEMLKLLGAPQAHRGGHPAQAFRA